MKKKTKSLVEFHNGEGRAGTLLIAEGFQREHKNVTRLVKKHIKKFENLGVVNERKFQSTGGRPVIEYWLNEQQAVFLGTLFRNQNEIVVDFKLDLVKKFFEMRNELTRLEKRKKTPDHIEARVSGKVVRLLETDTIKKYIEYCFEQGSTNAQRYYGNLTRMMNTTLFIIEGKFKNLREWMDTEQLKVVAIVEKIIDNALQRGMEDNLEYHDVFKLTKKKVSDFVEMYGKTTIASTQITQTKQLQLF